MSEKNEIWMETTHGRKSKCKTEFKAVWNKVLIGTLILTSVLGTATPAFAADTPSSLNISTNNSYTQEYGVSVETAISNIQNTIDEINRNRASGAITEAKLADLANQLYSLETAVRASGNKANSDVIAIINSAEEVASKFDTSNASKVKIAVAVVRESLGIQADSATVAQYSANTTITFSDVNPTDWFYEAVMSMTKIGLISGTTTPVNGVGTFAPNKSMTRAEFVTVVTRHLYPNEVKAMSEELKGATPWYMANYEVAIEEGLLDKYDFTLEAMADPMTRQEMAMVLVRAMEEQGESISGATVSATRIPDFNQIGTKYRTYVKIAYTQGLIAGTDTKGTFSPNGTLTRGQAATVLYRLIEEETRNPINVKDNNSNIGVNQDTGVESEGQGQGQVATGAVWVEGETHLTTDIKAGAVVIKADGTRVTIEVGPGGVLRAPGCDIYSGATSPDGNNTTEEGKMAWFDKSIFVKDPITGEMYSQKQWRTLRQELFPDRHGAYDGEIVNTWFKWDEGMGRWWWIGGQIG